MTSTATQNMFLLKEANDKINETLLMQKKGRNRNPAKTLKSSKYHIRGNSVEAKLFNRLNHVSEKNVLNQQIRTLAPIIICKFLTTPLFYFRVGINGRNLEIGLI